MCGRFTLKANASDLAKEFGVNAPDDFNYESYNIAPSQLVPIVHLDKDQKKQLSMMEWGLLPFWAKGVRDTVRPINARLETVSKNPKFVSSFLKKRCLVPASGFYEWSAKSKPKQPFYFYETDRPLFAFAGLWDIWDKGGTPMLTFTIITKQAEGLVRDIHGRMPFVLKREHYEPWLAEALLPDKSPALSCHAVSLNVNTPRNNDASLIAKAGH